MDFGSTIEHFETQIWKNHIEYEIGLLERLGNGIHEPTHRVWHFSFETNFKTGAWPQLVQFGKAQRRPGQSDVNEDLVWPQVRSGT